MTSPKSDAESDEAKSHRWQRRKAERPGEITCAALSLFVEKGYAATRLDEVAHQAGVSKGTLYRYFENKEALFKAVVREMIVPELEKAEALVRGYQGSARDLLQNMVYHWWQSVGESRLCGLPKLILSEAGNFPEIARFYHEEVITRGHNIVADAVRLGSKRGEFRPCDPDYVARLIMSPLVFASMWKTTLLMFEKEPFDFQRYWAQHLDLLFNGILQQQPDKKDG